mmetsp:Transcript_33166/g.95442  ORF Transcript_33166/g.95442 Transcript_33166/m.95442 type:complete len:241 (-) Transcript_33166:742-1464(-)
MSVHLPRAQVRGELSAELLRRRTPCVCLRRFVGERLGRRHRLPLDGRRAHRAAECRRVFWVGWQGVRAAEGRDVGTARRPVGAAPCAGAHRLRRLLREGLGFEHWGVLEDSPGPQEPGRLRSVLLEWSLGRDDLQRRHGETVGRAARLPATDPARPRGARGQRGLLPGRYQVADGLRRREHSVLERRSRPTTRRVDWSYRCGEFGGLLAGRRPHRISVMRPRRARLEQHLGAVHRCLART